MVFRRAVEHDREFLKYMLELTEPWSGGTRELPPYFHDDLEPYVCGRLPRVS